MGNAPAGQISPRGNCAIVVCLSRETAAATVPAAGLSQTKVSSHPNFQNWVKKRRRLNGTRREDGSSL